MLFRSVSQSRYAGGILAIVPATANGNAIYGVVTSIDGVVATPIYGVLSDLELEQTFNTWPGMVHMDSINGVVTELYTTTGLLHINYIKDPAPLESVTDELLVTPIFDTALKYYVIGQAYSDDLDSQYQAKAGDAMAMYSRELQTVGYPTDATDGTRATQYTPNYISPFGN